MGKRLGGVRPVTGGDRSRRTLGPEGKRADLNGPCSGAAALPQPAVRSAPWLAFNATLLPSPPIASAPTLGPNHFLLGANLPWIRYGLDVGASAASPLGGLHADQSSAARLEAALARLHRDGLEYARVFLFCDGRAGIRFHPDGTPEGLDDQVFADMDVLLATATRHRIALCLVLFDAGLLAAPSVVDGLPCGGHADVLADAAKRGALLEHVIEPLLGRYGAHPAIAAWDLFDEPECATLQMHCPYPVPSRRWGGIGRAVSAFLRRVGLGTSQPPAATLVEASAMRSYLAAGVEAVHQQTKALATVGLASTGNFALVQGLGLDFYQAHWWEPYGDARLRRAAADFGLDRPLVLGAFPTAMRNKSVKTVLDTARCAGYGGAFAWSMCADDGRGTEDGQLAQWVRNHAAQLFRRPVRAESPLEIAPALPPPETPLPAEPLLIVSADRDDEDEPRVSRGSDENEAPALAAAPA